MNKKHFLVAMALTLCLVVPFADAAEKRRSGVKEFIFEFTLAEGSISVSPLSISVLPLINESNIERHTKNTKKALKKIEPHEYQRVVGYRSNAYGAPVIRFLAPDPTETTIRNALEQEFKVLGVTSIPSPISEAPENFRTATLREIAEDFSGAKPDVLMGIAIQDIFFETRPGMIKLKMDIFMSLELTVFDMKQNDIVWEGDIEAGNFETKALVMGNKAVKNRLNTSFQALIESILRNNTELLAELSKTR